MKREEENKRLERLKNIVLNMPDKPGSYQFYDINNEIIYVGKAKSLKKRVSSYFHKEVDRYKTRVLVSKIENITYTVVNSEEDALLLENSLIKKYNPRYNILLKDGKTIRNLQAEKKLNRTFAAPKEGIYNGEKRERRGEHEHRISTERELSDSNDRYAEGRANANRQIRTDEERLPERTSQIDFLQHADGLQLKRASEEHGQGGRGDAGTSDFTDGEERGRERGTESSRHDELGSEDE